jgi:starch-binding outer membrane protein, SusD/RagB family
VLYPLSLFNPASPYANRDPRLGLYVVYNGSTFWGQVITTGVGGGRNAKDSIPTSTRTGYYMRKLLREDVNAGTVTPATKKHYEVHMRWTEMFLNYAEAANEAYGPDGSGTYPITARQVIAAIRKRAGITQPDNYLATITDPAGMRTLIRNERRLELCFEGFRFWDLRRWKADLTETAKGINIDKAKTTFTTVNVESRVYNNTYMDYGPIPAREVIKYNALIQNKGW